MTCEKEDNKSAETSKLTKMRGIVFEVVTKGLASSSF